MPPAIPPYAILSHTWADKEVSFQDVQQGLAQSRRGYEKVANACALAAEDGFEYIVYLYRRVQFIVMLTSSRVDRHLLHRQVKLGRALRSYQLHVPIVPRRRSVLRIPERRRRRQKPSRRGKQLPQSALVHPRIDATRAHHARHSLLLRRGLEADRLAGDAPRPHRRHHPD